MYIYIYTHTNMSSAYKDADDSILMAESEEEIKSLLMK